MGLNGLCWLFLLFFCLAAIGKGERVAPVWLARRWGQGQLREGSSGHHERGWPG